MPARNAFIEPLERFPKVGFAFGVNIEVVVKLVNEVGEVLELAVETLDARGSVRTVYESLDGVGVVIEKLDVEADAGDGIDAGLGDLVLLGFSQRLALFFLPGEGGATSNEKRMAARVRMAVGLRRVYSSTFRVGRVVLAARIARAPAHEASKQPKNCVRMK